MGAPAVAQDRDLHLSCFEFCPSCGETGVLVERNAHDARCHRDLLRCCPRCGLTFYLTINPRQEQPPPPD